jgi:steroid delta-isomerase-like uncharacterized protein
MDDTRATALRFYELLNQRRLDELERLVDDGYVGHGMGGAGGPAAVRQDLESMTAAFPDLDIAVEDTVSEGDRIAVKTTLRGTHRGPFAGVPASGNTIEVGGCDVFRLREGKIVEAWTLCDSGTLFMQIGAFGAPVAS